MRILLALLLATTLAGCRGKEDTDQNPGPIVEPNKRRGQGTLAFDTGSQGDIEIRGSTTFDYVGNIVVTDSAEVEKRILFLLPGNRLPRTTRTYTLTDGKATPMATQAGIIVSDLSEGNTLEFYSKGGEQVTLTVDASKKVSCTIAAAAMRASTFTNPLTMRSSGTLTTKFTFIAEEDMFE